MCGRYSVDKSPEDLAALLDAINLAGELAPSYNVAPTDPVPAVVVRHDRRELLPVRWGLVPSWSKDMKGAARMINARFESVAEKPSFRAAYQRRRCLLPANGYYEWTPATEPKGKPQPYLFTPNDGGLLTMAGIYEVWKDAEGALWWTCAVITTEAPDGYGHIHDRTPMVVRPVDWAAWLDPDNVHADGLVMPALAGDVHVTKVSTAVNSVKNNGPELNLPVAG